jgi:hypothetical protein
MKFGEIFQTVLLAIVKDTNELKGGRSGDSGVGLQELLLPIEKKLRETYLEIVMVMEPRCKINNRLRKHCCTNVVKRLETTCNNILISTKLSTQNI